MCTKLRAVASGLCLGLAVAPGVVHAQTLDQLGNRAAALGAFVAVADDASAVVWNPAGLVNGPIFNVLLDSGHGKVEPPFGGAGRAARGTTYFLAAGVPPLGISYYRVRQTELSPAAESVGGREDRQVVVRSLMTTHLGVTVLQSLAEGVTVGATAKLVRGSFVSGAGRAASWDSGFEQAEVLEGTKKTTGDVDVGAMVAKGRFRVGVVARNLAAPRFEDRTTGCTTGCPDIALRRQARVGAAWADSWPGISTLMLAVDADLTRVRYPAGDRRDVAFGAERWLAGQRFAVRGGIRASTIGEVRPVGTAGASYAVRNGIYVDVYAAKGRDNDRRWGIAGRLMY